MGKGSSAPAPAAPDPKETADAQAKLNLKSATTQQALNMVNQSTPTGSATYTMRPGADPRHPKPGDYILTTALAAPEQHALDQQRQFDDITNRTGIAQAGRVEDVLSKPVDLNNDARSEERR